MNALFVELLIGVGFSIGLAWIARKKGYNPFIWVFTGLPGLVAVLCLKNVNRLPDEIRKTEMKRGDMTGFALISVTVVSLVLFFPVISPPNPQANTVAVLSRGKDIYVAIVGANAERAPLGLGTVWPRTENTEEGGDGISKMTFTNSTDYFRVLGDSEHIGTQNLDEWHPYVNGFYFSKLAGAGVPAWDETRGHLTAENNMWTIAANVTDDMPDVIPILITRNVDPASLIPAEGDLRKQHIRPSREFKTPFGNKQIIIIRKGGATFSIQWKNATLHYIYGGQDTQELRNALQKIKYLAP